MKKITLIVLTITISIFANAQNDSTIQINLDDAIVKALENNYQILISKKDLEVSKNNNSWGKAGSYPTVTIGASQSNIFNNSENQMTGERTDLISNSVRPNLNAQMVLFNGFAIKFNKKNLETYQQMSETNLRMTLENTVTDVTNAYYSVILENEKLKVVETLMNLSKDRYKYVQLKKDLGVAVTYDVLQFKNNFLTDSANYLMQNMKTETAKRELSKTLGDNNISNYQPTGNFVITDTTYSLGDLENMMLQNNSVLKAQYLNAKVIENSIKLAKSSLYPSLTIAAGSDYTNSRTEIIDPSNTSNSYNYGAYANLNLSYTIFNGNNRKRSINNAKIEAEKLQLKIEELEMIMRNNLYTIWQLFENRKQLVKVAEENFKAAKLNLDIASEKFNSGAINSFNYRDIQMMYLNTSYAYLQSKYNLIITENDLKKMVGSLIK